MIWSWKLLFKSSLWSGWSTSWKMEWLFWWWICYMCFCFQANVEWDEFPGWSSWRGTEPKEHEPKFKKKRRSKVKYQHLAPGQMLADVGRCWHSLFDHGGPKPSNGIYGKSMKIWGFSQAWKSRFQFVVFGIWSKTWQDTASDLIVLCHLTVSFCLSGYLCFLLGLATFVGIRWFCLKIWYPRIAWFIIMFPCYVPLWNSCMVGVYRSADTPIYNHNKYIYIY